MLSLPREVIEMVANCPGITLTLYRTCRRFRDELRGMFRARVIAPLNKSLAVFEKKSTGTISIIMTDGPTVRVSGGKLPVVAPESAITVRYRHKQVWINENSLLLSTPDGGALYFGVTDDLPHIRGLLQFKFSDIYRITRVSYNITGVLMAFGDTGRYLVAAIDNDNIQICRTDVHPADIRGCILTLEQI